MKILIHFLLIISGALFFYGCTEKSSDTPEVFQVEEGLHLDLIAAEPLIKDPVDLEFDEKGNALVLEMPGYPFEDQKSRIVLLKDRDNDGTYDDRVIFAEGLELASSILPYNKGILVAAPPYLLHIQDTDGDDKADKTDTLMSGFSTGNLQHNYNGLTYGLDNWIYAANGGNSGQPFWWGDSSSVLNLRGEDFRFRLTDKKIERIGESSGGFGLAMNEWGHLFETHNLEHISQLVFPQRYYRDVTLSIPHSLRNISDHEENGLSRIYPIGEQASRVNHPEQSGYFSGSCGITYYGGGGLGPDYEQTIWVADVVLNLIHLDRIEDLGSRKKASRVFNQREVIACTDRSFRPVNMSVGPTGELFIVDMYREVIEHPEWIPDDIEATLDLNAGKDKGRIYRISQKNSPNDAFDPALFTTTNGLVAALGHPNQWIRNTAQRIVMEDPLTSEETEAIVQLLTDDNHMARLHSLWVLDQQNILSVNQLLAGMNDAQAGVRENALIIAELYINDYPQILTQAISSLNDENQRVRMQAALTISMVNNANQIDFKDQLFSAVNASVTLPSDEWNIAALTLALKAFPGEAFEFFVSQDGATPAEILVSLGRMASRNQEELSKVIDKLSTSALQASVKADIIRAINIAIPDDIAALPLMKSIVKIETTTDSKLLSAVTGLRKKLNLSPSKAFLAKSKEAMVKIADEKLSTEERLQQMELLDLLPIEQKSRILFSCLNNKEAIVLQEAALKQLWEAHDPDIGYQLVKKWPELGPSARKYAGDILLYKAAHHDALLTGLENGIINIGEMNFDLERRRTLLWWTDNEKTKQRAEALFSDSGVVNRKEAIASMQDALSLAGSPTQGLEVFNTLCAQCHVYGTQGKDVGPVLTEINRKSKEQLMNDILDPNAAADTKYINHKIETTDGTLHIGIVDRESDQNVIIKKMGGQAVTIEKRNIKSFVSLGTSMMPEGLEGNMTLQDMADLLAFLQNNINTTL